MTGAASNHIDPTRELGELLERWRALREPPLDRLAALVARWGTAHHADFLAEREAGLRRAQLAIERFRASRLAGFDAFRIAGFAPQENDLSNALAALLDPKRPHGLGKGAIGALLEVAAASAHFPLAPLREAFEHADASTITVQRERSEDAHRTRPDIVIWSPTFAILVENKARGGSETWVADESQTDRQAAALRSFCAARGIDEVCSLGVLLSPEGTKPANEHAFVAVSTERLARALLLAAAQADSPHAASIGAFLEFCTWL